MISLVLCGALALSARAQSDNARVVTGMVRDSTGALLVRASVVITTTDGSDPVEIVDAYLGVGFVDWGVAR